ncbi:adhesin, partial [Spiroplasma sp. ald]|uniref:adhesin n=1 Tax=Spiroplasma sp. ald TaxID=2490849 RepID=UPI0037DCB79E
MKKLLSLLTITTLTASVPAPLLANATLERTKRDLTTTTRDVTTGFDVSVISILNKWNKVDNRENEFSKPNNKWYFYIRVIDKYKCEKVYFDSNFIKNQNTYWQHLKYGINFPVYRWDDVGEPETPIIDSNGNVTDWNLKIKDNYLFQQGILFSLVDGSKTAKWSNNGMRLTVDGETNINIDNPNVTEVLWNGAKQNMLGGKVNINVKPETSEKTHKLVIKYDIRRTKYTSEDIDVVMAAKIDTPKPIVKENLSDVIKFGNENNLENIINNNDDTIFAAVNQKNGNVIDDFSQIEITNKDNHSATLTAKPDSKSYKGSVIVKYNFIPTAVVKVKINLTSSANGVQIEKNYLAQLDNTKMTNKVDTFYYANGKSTIKIKQPSTDNVITGVVYGCDDKWNKTSQSNVIDPINGLEIDKGQYGSIDGRYLVELQHQDLPTHKKTIYLQVSEKQSVEHYWNTDNGKQFEQWAEDNGYKNIRGYSENQLNELFELSKTWKQSLAHLDLKLDEFVVTNIKNVTQDEINAYKTKMLASVKSQVEKYAPNVVENTDYVIGVDNLIVGDWTTSKDVKVQAVDGSTKLLS